MNAKTHDFVLQNTRLRSLPLLPEIQLHLADEVIVIWRRMQEEAGDADMAPPFWAFAWVGGQALARYVLDHPTEVAGKRVVDLAAGSGLCAVAAMLAGAASALAADVDPYCRGAVALNAAVNRVTVEFTDSDLTVAGPPHADVVLAGDVCYEQPMADRVLSWLLEANRHGVRVLFGDPGRDYFPRRDLVQLAEYEVRTTRDLEGSEVRRAGVYTFPDPVARERQ